MSTQKEEIMPKECLEKFTEKMEKLRIQTQKQMEKKSLEEELRALEEMRQDEERKE